MNKQHTSRLFRAYYTLVGLSYLISVNACQEPPRVINDGTQTIMIPNNGGDIGGKEVNGAEMAGNELNDSDVAGTEFCGIEVSLDAVINEEQDMALARDAVRPAGRFDHASSRRL